MTLSISAIEKGLAHTRGELAHWQRVAACFEAGTQQRKTAEARIEYAELSLRANTKLVAFLRRRISLYLTFHLPPPPDIDA